MAEELQLPKDNSQKPDSIECLPVVNGEPVVDNNFSHSDVPVPHSVESAPNFVGQGGRMTVSKKSGQNTMPACDMNAGSSISNDLHLPGVSRSAFRPFITQTSLESTTEICSSSQNQTLVTSTPISKHNRRLTLPITTEALTPQTKSPSPSPNLDENNDGRTTASAPPCTPAPELHQQPQSPFRNNRQIKKIDLLAMSRSRQSDRAENARRDGRLAPSPRKKDEVLRNSGFTFPAGRGLRSHSSLRLSLQNNSLTSGSNELSPERLVNGSSSTASPNVDVVSVDDQPDPSKCTFSIQFHDFSTAEQMIKCSLCGFVTNNQKFYRRHRRLHSRQHQPDLIHCSLCDYSTSQIRKMREHTITSHHLPYPHSFTSSNQGFNLPSTMTESSHHPPMQGQMYIGTGSIFHPVTIRPINVPLETTASTTLSTASTLGLPTYIPTQQDHHIRVNSQAGLQHPPRGSAMLGNYAPNNEQQVASYMQSVISNLVSPSCTNSSAKSSNLYLHAARNLSQEVLQSNSTISAAEDSYNYRQFWNSNNSSLSNNQTVPETGGIKVKREPTVTPASIVPRNVYGAPSSTQKDRPTQSPRRQSDTLDSESGMDLSSDDHTSSSQTDAANSRVDARISTETNQTDNTSNVDGPTVGTSCTVPFIKIEFPPHKESCNLLGHSVCTHSDRGVQCDIISTSGLCHRQGHMQSETVSSAGGSACVETRCYFCGVTFDDEVLYSLHIGCHSHTDPFMCNVCGKQCHNKYGFYSHIMRGHQARPHT